MARGTLGTGMMAPLQMANNFHGGYYAGPSGAAMGALMASQAIGDGFRDWGASKGRRQDEAKVQAEKDRIRMDELNQRQAVAQAINPMQAAESSGMGNRDMTRRMALPDAATQMGIYNLVEGKKKQERDADYQKKAAFAQAWAARRGYATDPTGENFMKQVGFNPFEFEGVSDIIAKAEEKEAQRAWQTQQSRILTGIGKGGDGNVGTWSITPDGNARFNNKTGEVIPLGGNYAKPSASTGQPGVDVAPQYLPVDVSARKNLASWIEQANDAARVISTLESAMGKHVDQKTGEVVFNEEPSSPFSGGTGLFLGMMPDKVAARIDQDGVPMRGAISGFASQIMNALSGAAVSEQEKKRLEGFLPTTSDSWSTLREKMYGYREFLREKGSAWGDTYGPHDVLERGLNSLDGPMMQGGGGGWSGDMASDADAIIERHRSRNGK